jgi:hypothetical protein
MGGGLMQLVAYGAQDIYLTGNPQITFFKVVYRRHTNFSMESIVQSLDGTPGFGQSIDCTISRTGDLVHKVYVKLELKTDAAATGDSGSFSSVAGPSAGVIAICENLGSACMEQMDLEIGGQLIDRHYGHWLETWAKLTEPSLGIPEAIGQSAKILGSHEVLIGPWTNFELNNTYSSAETSEMAGKKCAEVFCHSTNIFKATTGYGGVPGVVQIDVAGGTKFRPLYIPLQFWFCRNPGLALPLIALQYHEVKLKLKFTDVNKLNLSAEAASKLLYTLDAEVLVDYIYLDTDERRRFAQVSHEYLIEQLQFQNSSSSKKHELVFNHPCKELIWGGVPKAHTELGTSTDGQLGFGDAKQEHFGPSTLTPLKGNFSEAAGKGGDFLPTFGLTLNGHDRISQREYEYFTRVQVNQHHSGVGGLMSRGMPTNGGSAGPLSQHRVDSIAVYSFALKPEEHQPSGTCNFSRIDNAELVSDKAQALYIYAVNYNVLRIMSGMGGLAYSN